MDPNTTHALLKRLHDQLRSADSGDPGTRDVVTRVSTQLQPMVDAGPGKAPKAGVSSLRERLQEAAVHFEVSHPELARSIEGAIDALGSYGI